MRHTAERQHLATIQVDPYYGELLLISKSRKYIYTKSKLSKNKANKNR